MLGGTEALHFFDAGRKLAPGGGFDGIRGFAALGSGYRSARP